MPKTQRRPNNLAFIHRDRGYRWQEIDPRMEEIRGLITDSGLTTHDISQKVANLTHGVYKVAASTMDNWMNGKTKRPLSFGMMWVEYALGYERVLRKIK